MAPLLLHDNRNYGQDLEVTTHTDVPLKLKQGVARELLELERFQHTPTEDLIATAKRRMKNRVHVRDRATAIALLLPL